MDELIDVAYTPVLLKGTQVEGFYEVPEVKAIICSNLSTSLDQVVSQIVTLYKSIVWYS